MFCKYCGSEIEDNSKFCEKCGKKLDEAVPAAEAESPVKKKKSKKKWIILAVAADGSVQVSENQFLQHSLQRQFGTGN